MNTYRLSAKAAAVVTAFMICVWALLADTRAGAQSDDDRCSDRTLHGAYGFAIDGQILAGPFTGVLRGVAMTQFDGRGNLEQVDFATINGVPRWTGWRPVTGTYEINADCTGAALLYPSDGSPTLHLRLVVADHGREIRTVVEGNATGSTGTRVN
jgi:hypothetical protein